MDAHNNIDKKYYIIIFLLILLLVCNFIAVTVNVLLYRNINSKFSNTANSNDFAIFDDKLPPSVMSQGKKDAKIKIVEFGDYQCPFCAEFHKTVFKELKANFIDKGKASFSYVNMPFLGEESFTASYATYCAADQSAYWQMHDKLFASQSGENTNSFTKDKLVIMAKSLNLNESDFAKCLEDKSKVAIVDEQLKLSEKVGIEATPTLYINNKKYQGKLDYVSLAKYLESLDE